MTSSGSCRWSAVILVLAFYPQFVLRRSEPTVKAEIGAEPGDADCERRAVNLAGWTAYAPLAAAHIKGPHIDWLSLMPLLILGGGALVVLLLGLLGATVVRERVVPFSDR